MIPRLSSNDLQFWETMYSSGVPVASSRGGLGIAYLERIGNAVTFEKNQILFRYDEIPDRFYVVKSGLVVAYEEQANGNELIYYILDKNTMIGEANMMLDRPATVNFKALEKTELICVTKTQLTEAMKNDPQLLNVLLFSVSNKFLEAMEELRKERNHSAAWRLCDTLLCFSERYGVPYDGKVLIQKNISLQSLAAMMGVNRATAVRAMRRLRDMGLVENINGFYCVRSIDSLRHHQELLDE